MSVSPLEAQQYGRSSLIKTEWKCSYRLSRFNSFLLSVSVILTSKDNPQFNVLPSFSSGLGRNGPFQQQQVLKTNSIVDHYYAGATSSQSTGQAIPQAASSRASSGTGQHRPVFLVVWPNALFNAYWAIFVPEAADRTLKKGKYVHVEGSPKEGFHHVIWDLNLTRRRPMSPIEVGWMLSDLVVDTPTNGGLVKDDIPKDQLEAILTSVPAPSPTLNSVSNGSASSGQRVDLSDCQWWVTRCIHTLVEKGYLVPPPRGLNRNVDPRNIVASAPRH